METEIPFPQIPAGLISALDKLFPDQAPRSDPGGLFEFGRLAGQQEVIDLLRRHQHKQQEGRQYVHESPQISGRS